MEKRQKLMPERNTKQPQSPLLYTDNSQEHKIKEWDLRQLLVVIRRRAIIIISVAIPICTTTWFLNLNREARYQGQFRLLVESVTAESKLAGLTQDSSTDANPQQEALDYDTQIQILQSPKLIAPVIKEIAIRYPDITYSSLISKLSISRFLTTKILEVSYQDSDPQKVQFVLQQLAQAYLKYSLEGRQTSIGQGRQFVDLQLPLLQLRVNSLQKQLQRFRQQYNLINPDDKAQQLSEQVSTLEEQRLDTQKQLAEARALYANLQKPSGSEEALKNDPVYQKLVGQLSDLENQLAVESAKFREDNPFIQGIKQKRENLLALLHQKAKQALGNKRQEVANQISLLNVRAAKIAQAENSLNQQVEQMPTLARQYTDLQRELKIASNSLNRFLEKRESLQIETAQKEIPWQLITAPALPQAPISPSPQRNLIMGVFAGLLAGIGAALLVERIDNVFHSSDELKEVTKLPLLGVIPLHKPLQQLVPAKVAVKMQPSEQKGMSLNLSNTQDKSYFAFSEAFRSLYTNIIFLGSSDTLIRSLVISSATQAEGKSTVATHLAQAAAAMGRRVLLVDADLRRSEIHNMLGLPNKQGLSNIISTNLPALEVIHRSPIWDNLFVLTAGQIPPDPTKLLSSQKMQTIMEQLRREFDLVIYDMPPLGLADTNLLANHADGIVLVVRMGKTDRSVLVKALEQLKTPRTSVLGVVCNSVKNYDLTPYNYSYYSHV